jgi:hypothetical protein
VQSLKTTLSALAAGSIAAFLFACSAAMVPYTSDPERKLGWAKELYKNQNRPIPADRLINEAIEIYQERGDQLGLAKAYSVYGTFLQSPAYHNNKVLNQREDSVRWKDRATKYFQQALEIFLTKQEYFDASNAVLNLGILQMNRDYSADVCRLFDQSLQLHQQARQKNANEMFYLPPGVSSFANGIDQLKKEAQCGA